MTIVPAVDQIAGLLEQFAARGGYVRGVVVLSADGLPKASHGLDTASRDQLAATATGMWSLAGSAASVFDGSETVRQVAAELDHTTLFVAAAGSGSRLAVVADRQARPALVSHEITMLIKKLQSHLATAARPMEAVPPVVPPVVPSDPAAMS
jgi:predicted regulator of Ras-like GTPase activity (Roadblock/LC7/MglB family)